jgi:hypothetical protein
MQPTDPVALEGYVGIASKMRSLSTSQERPARPTRPLAAAEVIVRSADGSLVRRSTDADGWFALPAIDLKGAEVTIDHPDYPGFSLPEMPQVTPERHFLLVELVAGPAVCRVPAAARRVSFSRR